MTTQIDLDINRGVRRIFIKHWIDLGRVSIRSAGGVVLVYGTLQRVPGRDALMSATVQAMFDDIRLIRNVKRVRPHLENWSNDGGLWKPVEKKNEGSP